MVKKGFCLYKDTRYVIKSLVLQQNWANLGLTKVCSVLWVLYNIF